MNYYKMNFVSDLFGTRQSQPQLQHLRNSKQRSKKQDTVGQIPCFLLNVTSTDLSHFLPKPVFAKLRRKCFDFALLWRQTHAGLSDAPQTMESPIKWRCNYVTSFRRLITAHSYSSVSLQMYKSFRKDLRKCFVSHIWSETSTAFCISFFWDL